MEFVLIWFLFGMAAGIIAHAKGRSGCGWFLLGFMLGPFGLIVIFLPSAANKMQQKAVSNGQAGPYRKCPHCAEPVRLEARRCRFCGSPLTPMVSDSPLIKRCSQCAHLNPEDAAICTKCGHRFGW